MALTRVECVVTIGANKYLIQLPDEYQNIADIVGVKKVADAADVEGAIPSSESALKDYGLLTQIRVGLGAESPVGRKLKYHQIVCTTEKLASARTGLHGKDLSNITGSSTIRNVGFKRRKTLS